MKPQEEEEEERKDGSLGGGADGAEGPTDSRMYTHTPVCTADRQSCVSLHSVLSRSQPSLPARRMDLKSR